MVSPQKYFDLLKDNGIDFYTGVPDSSLKNFTAYITDNVSREKNIIAANEGACIGLASGYHLATGKVPFVYMQNSGIGNAVNPLLSLADDKVYQIPMILMIGWRGEPGVKDEPQHLKQGDITLSLLDTMAIPYVVLDCDQDIAFDQTVMIIRSAIEKSIPHAIVVKPSVFDKYKLINVLRSPYPMSREDALKLLVDSLSDDDIVVSTTGKLSRELFEYREELNQTHEKDFLTVGAMGHSSSIALGIALQKKKQKVFCLDGDGSVLMHTGALATIGSLAPENFFHILFNNGSHESVGGQPTVGFDVDFTEVASGYLYRNVKCVDNKEELLNEILKIKKLKGPILLEIKVGINSRDNLGRPTISPVENKKDYMSFIK